jgi:PKD repeat protein
MCPEAVSSSRISRLEFSLLLVTSVSLLLLASPASAEVSLSSTAATRAEAVSGVAPVLEQPSDMTLDVGEAADQTLHATDADGEPLTFLKQSGPDYMTVTTTDSGSGVATGNVHLEPGVSDEGSLLATVGVSDGTLFDSKFFRITVVGTPAAPVLTQPSDMTVSQGAAEPQDLFATDSNGDPLEFSLVSGPTFVTVATIDPGGGSALGQITVSPGYTDLGTFSATVSVSDGALTDEKTLSITVIEADAAPVMVQPQDMHALVGYVLDQAVTATDANGDPLTFSKVAGPDFMDVTTVDPGTGTGTGNIRLTPGPDDVIATSGTVRVSDGELSDERIFGISVRVESAPVFSYQLYAMSVPAGATADQYLQASDADFDVLTFTKVSGPDYMSVTTYARVGNTDSWYGEIHLAPSESDEGSATGVVRVSDGILADEQSFGITILPPNHPPVISPLADMTVMPGEIAWQQVTATDPDGDYMYLNKYSGPSYVTVSGSGTGTVTAEIRVAPLASDVGTAQVTIYAYDYVFLVTASFTVTVLPGNFPPPCPAESFETSVVWTGSPAQGVQAADMDGDGILDLVTERYNEGKVAIYTGAGDGTFLTPPLLLTAGTWPIAGAVADFNGDQVPDLAVSNYGSMSVSIFLGDGLGGFGPATDFPCGTSLRGMATADVDRDGKMDVVVILLTPATGSKVALLRGLGDGGLAPPVTVLDGPYYFYDVALPDLNGDGAPDLVATNASDKAITARINDGSGGWGPPIAYPLALPTTGLTAGDVNGDGKTDLIASSSQSVIVLLGEGTGSMGAPRYFSTGGSNTLYPAIVDWNGDGFADIATTKQAVNAVSFLLGDGTGSFSPYTTVSLPSAWGIAKGDFDGDLRTDLAIASTSSAQSLTTIRNACAPAPDHPPVVHAPKLVAGAEAGEVTFGVTATDPDGPSLTALTASFAGLPLGNDATFTEAPDHASGTFAWTPAYEDARPMPYLVTFTATNVISGTGVTKITVANTNRPPSAQAGGPYSGFAGSPVQFDGTGSLDPDGDALTYSWVYGDGATGSGVNPAHAYASVGAYGVALTVTDGTLSALGTTTVTIVSVLPARAFTTSSYRTIRMNAGKPQWCAALEPVSGSYRNVDVNPGTLVLRSVGTGSVSEIHALQGKGSVSGDQDGNGIEDLGVCFAKADLRELFGDLHGSNSVTVVIEASLYSGGLLHAELSVEVVASGAGQLAATVSPNPLNPEAVLTFTTTREGFARVSLFDLRGRLVRRLLDERSLAPGYHDVRVDGRDERGVGLASGVYFYRIEAAEGKFTGQLTVLQ